MKIAALLNENGAEVQLVTRGLLHWLSGDSMQNRTMGFLLQAAPASRDSKAIYKFQVTTPGLHQQ